jgi:hypothetical protein
MRSLAGEKVLSVFILRVITPCLHLSWILVVPQVTSDLPTDNVGTIDPSSSLSFIFQTREGKLDLRRRDDADETEIGC